MFLDMKAKIAECETIAELNALESMYILNNVESELLYEREGGADYPYVRVEVRKRAVGTGCGHLRLVDARAKTTVFVRLAKR